jgi:hypothetical protein
MLKSLHVHAHLDRCLVFVSREAYRALLILRPPPDLGLPKHDPTPDQNDRAKPSPTGHVSCLACGPRRNVPHG